MTLENQNKNSSVSNTGNRVYSRCNKDELWKKSVQECCMKLKPSWERIISGMYENTFITPQDIEHDVFEIFVNTVNRGTLSVEICGENIFFYTVNKSLCTKEKIGSLYHYLGRIGINRIIKLYRDEKRKVVFMDEFHQSISQINSSLDESEKVEIYDKISLCLNPLDRKIIELNVLEGLPLKEVYVHLKELGFKCQSVNNLAQRKKRALNKLRLHW